MQQTRISSIRFLAPFVVLDEIVINDMTITRVKSFQYLGLTLDETLRFNEHVQMLVKLLIKYFGIFH